LDFGVREGPAGKIVERRYALVGGDFKCFEEALEGVKLGREVSGDASGEGLKPKLKPIVADLC
jgi:hypothetical protein